MNRPNPPFDFIGNEKSQLFVLKLVREFRR
jgi:hypothetical protein